MMGAVQAGLGPSIGRCVMLGGVDIQCRSEVPPPLGDESCPNSECQILPRQGEVACRRHDGGGGHATGDIVYPPPSRLRRATFPWRGGILSKVECRSALVRTRV